LLKLLIVGAGGHGQSLSEAASLAAEFEVVGFLDDAVASWRKVLGIPVLGSVGDAAKYRHLCDQVIVAIGNNAMREAMCQRLVDLGFHLATVIHPKAYVAPSALVGAGSAVMAGAVVGTEATLGCGSIVNCGAVVDHHAVVEDFGHLGVNACMAGGTVLGRGAWMQAGSALGYGVHVPPAAVLAPGQALVAGVA
jgi:sugar O-acyltransferase (sialic acid O-acetyltransferase NeuD family)